MRLVQHTKKSKQLYGRALKYDPEYSNNSIYQTTSELEPIKSTTPTKNDDILPIESNVDKKASNTSPVKPKSSKFKLKNPFKKS